jgi:hypothetical protein
MNKNLHHLNAAGEVTESIRQWIKKAEAENLQGQGDQWAEVLQHMKDAAAMVATAGIKMMDLTVYKK